MSGLAERSAFPIDPQGTEPHPGMTMRQHYAGLALQGLLANPYVTRQAAHATEHSSRAVELNYAAHALTAPGYADALIAQLEVK